MTNSLNYTNLFNYLLHCFLNLYSYNGIWCVNRYASFTYLSRLVQDLRSDLFITENHASGGYRFEVIKITFSFLFNTRIKLNLHISILLFEKFSKNLTFNF